MLIFGSFFVVFVTVALADKKNDAEQSTQIFIQYSKECQQKLGLSDDFIKGSIKEEEKNKLGAFLLCYNNKLGVLTPAGDLVDEKIKSFYKELGEKDETIKEVLTRCRPIKDKTPTDKALYYAQCLETINENGYRKNNPQLVEKFQQYPKECKKELGISDDIFKKSLVKLNEEDKKTLGKLSLCVSIKMGVLTSTGTLVDDKIRDIYKSLGEDDKTIGEILTKCKAPEDYTPELKAFFYTQCLDTI